MVAAKTFVATHLAANRLADGGFEMKRALFFSVLAVLVAATSAMAQDVRYNFDKDTDFSKFKTYKWVDLKGAAKLDDLREKQIKAAVDAELAKQGGNQGG
jgi:hypothetical protein